ncbi:GntR family transcriptional regulator [Denitromonas iodatirespirans]|uniref:FCD domain-containing protein n=1 Tax=Denitromonas iodatirespirans TaxID=2795389 RepID=A0A944H7H2_DENI1|nr:FCD domain-containing protein [Denitromonas iodatirespirans]MBT0961179.1 FCD domain-containing protein [Denitromonas iodatirespirans]
MNEQGPDRTLIEVAIERLSADIVSGALQPGRKLLIAELKKRYEIGASPLREALAKLSSDGFVVFDSRRGFRVAEVSQADLEDITRVRKSIECEALKSAIANGDDEWDVGIVAASARLHRLAVRAREADPPTGTDVERAHRQFHTALLAACDSPRLLSLQQLFYDQAQRYRAVMMRQWHGLDEAAEVHQQLADVVLSRDVDRACSALSEHIDLTLQSVYPEGADGVRPHTNAEPKSRRNRQLA